MSSGSGRTLVASRSSRQARQIIRTSRPERSPRAPLARFMPPVATSTRALRPSPPRLTRIVDGVEQCPVGRGLLQDSPVAPPAGDDSKRPRYFPGNDFDAPNE